jgi:hypothetical protein
MKGDQSLIYASNIESNWNPLNQRAISVVFLGTPHRGTEWANRLYLSQLGASIFWRPSNWVALIRKRNPELFTVAETFNSIWGQRSVLTIIETKRVHVLGKVSSKAKDHKMFYMLTATTDCQAGRRGDKLRWGGSCRSPI